ncbi:MAG: GNAT family N-acetyltransferase, partial [Planctomycetes bacterium]|nr:GNAT family N-acetyltransferase [Planctomycetota bacterium]
MLRVLGLGNLFAAVETLGKGFDPKGDRLAIVGNGGGLGVLATDALIEGGGRLAELEPATVAELDGVLPPTWSRGNPVDIIGDADGPRYARAVETLLAAPEADAVLVLNCPTAVASSLEAAEAVVGTLRGRKRPVLAGWVGESEAAGARRRLGEARIPCYATPAEAVEG